MHQHVHCLLHVSHLISVMGNGRQNRKFGRLLVLNTCGRKFGVA